MQFQAKLKFSPELDLMSDNPNPAIESSGGSSYVSTEKETLIPCKDTNTHPYEQILDLLTRTGLREYMSIRRAAVITLLADVMNPEGGGSGK